MKFPPLDRYFTGVAVQVSGLRSEKSEGTGDFFDLLPLAEWCRSCGIDLIQLLPVQDTGFQSSPYSALSAFALHPLFMRLSELPEADGERDAIGSLIEAHASDRRLSYETILNRKLGILGGIYEKNGESIRKDGKLRAWIGENPWIKTYAAFLTLKNGFGRKSWREWPRMKDPSPEDIEAFWSSGENAAELYFHAWVQYRLDGQFEAVSKKIDRLGILLKGDIPILMNDDSADVWSNRSFFNLDLQAGAPPDYYSETGQNWGFPIYDWDALKKAGYSWWKARLHQAARYYHAFRIDHVLGFFRIWSIPTADFTGYLGHFRPARYIARKDLHAAGFDDGRIRWLSLPHVTLHAIGEAAGTDTWRVAGLCMDRIGNEDLFNFKPEIGGERDINSLPVADGVKEKLGVFFRNRALVEIDKDVYSPVWTYKDSSSYSSLTDEEKRRFDDLVNVSKEGSEKIWKKNGKALLSFMKEETEMLPCAEDLGAVPKTVPGVLKDLSILSLKIPRWFRNFSVPEQPMYPLQDYPYLSVCTPSVHDTSTLRQWWTEEPGREDFWKILGYESPCPEEYTPGTAGMVVDALLETASCMCIFQIQEFLDLEPGYRDDSPGDSRINVPGTLSDTNWSYRMRPTLEELSRNDRLVSFLKKNISARKKRKI